MREESLLFVGPEPDAFYRAAGRYAERMLRPARPEECAALSELARRSKALWGYSPEFMANCAAELTVTAACLPHLFVLETSAGVVGFHALRIHEQRIDERAAELEFLFVDPQHVRRGHGQRLLEHAPQHAREVMGVRKIVIQGDPHADAFYRAAGARRVGERASASIPGRLLPVYELDC
jgi:GNAT superfamily N-acetyltransferase